MLFPAESFDEWIAGTFLFFADVPDIALDVGVFFPAARRACIHLENDANAMLT